MTIEVLGEEIAHYCGLAARVIDQARRRVLDGEQVPTAEKIYSIFEPDTDLIKRGKVKTPVEFGHKVFPAESAKGLITQYEILKGNPSGEIHVAPALQRHRRAFRRAPDLYGADRGFFSETNVAAGVRGAVTTVCIPQRSGSKTPQRQAYPNFHLRKIAGVQRGPALSRRHRGPHFGIDAWSRHEALPRRGRRALRVVCRRRGARQQPRDHWRAAEQASITATETIPIMGPELSARGGSTPPRFAMSPAATSPGKRHAAPKTTGKTLANPAAHR
jgi:hypothetical protein